MCKRRRIRLTARSRRNHLIRDAKAGAVLPSRRITPISMDMAADSVDEPTLATLIASASPDAFERRLADLLAAVDPVVRDAVRRTLRGHFHADRAIADDVDDIAGEAF